MDSKLVLGRRSDSETRGHFAGGWNVIEMVEAV